MKREELEHVLRASAAITTDKSFVVIGSQAVLLPRALNPATIPVEKFIAWAQRRAQEAST